VLKRAEDGAVAFETVFKCVLMDLVTRRAVEIPADVRDRAETLREAEAPRT
jgi:acyl-CoA thioester hydrolase